MVQRKAENQKTKILFIKTLSTFDMIQVTMVPIQHVNKNVMYIKIPFVVFINSNGIDPILSINTEQNRNESTEFSND